MNKQDGIRDAIRSMGGQRAVAEYFNLSQQAVSLWAQQGYAPVQKAKALAEATGLPVRDLVSPHLRDLVR